MRDATFFGGHPAPLPSDSFLLQGMPGGPVRGGRFFLGAFIGYRIRFRGTPRIPGWGVAGPSSIALCLGLLAPLRYETLKDAEGSGVETGGGRDFEGLFIGSPTPLPYDTPPGGCRGGRAWRARDLVLLDEPTNHLDIEGIGYLVDFLNNTTKSLAMPPAGGTVDIGCWFSRNTNKM